MQERLDYLRNIANRKKRFLVFCTLNNILRDVIINFKVLQKKRKEALRLQFSRFIIKLKLKIAIKRKGPTIDERNRRFMKQHLALLAVFKTEPAEYRAKNILLKFFRRVDELT